MRILKVHCGVNKANRWFYPEPYESNSHFHSLFFKIQFNVIPIYDYVFHIVSWLRLPHKNVTYVFLIHPSSMPAGNKYFPPLQNFQTVSGIHLASYSMRTVVLYGRQSGRGVKFTSHFRGVKFTSHFHLTPRLKGISSIYLRPLHETATKRGTNLPFAQAHHLSSSDQPP